jgi:hypothetical protein
MENVLQRRNAPSKERHGVFELYKLKVPPFYRRLSNDSRSAGKVREAQGSCGSPARLDQKVRTCARLTLNPAKLLYLGSLQVESSFANWLLENPVVRRTDFEYVVHVISSADTM